MAIRAVDWVGGGVPVGVMLIRAVEEALAVAAAGGGVPVGVMVIRAAGAEVEGVTEVTFEAEVPLGVTDILEGEEVGALAGEVVTLTRAELEEGLTLIREDEGAAASINTDSKTDNILYYLR